MLCVVGPVLGGQNNELFQVSNHPLGSTDHVRHTTFNKLFPATGYVITCPSRPRYIHLVPAFFSPMASTAFSIGTSARKHSFPVNVADDPGNSPALTRDRIPSHATTTDALSLSPPMNSS